MGLTRSPETMSQPETGVGHWVMVHGSRKMANFHLWSELLSRRMSGRGPHPQSRAAGAPSPSSPSRRGPTETGSVPSATATPDSRRATAV